MNGACSVKFFFGPAPWGPGDGSKGQIIILFQLQSQFQRFLYQTLCVFSQMKDTKHIRRDFILSPGSCPRGGTLGGWGCPGGQNFFFSNMVMWYIKSNKDDEQNRMQVKFSS